MPGAWAALVIVAAFVLSGLKVLREYERAVVFRLGRLVGARGPGVIYVIPGIEKALRIDLRTITMDIPSQDVITKDNVSITSDEAAKTAVVDFVAHDLDEVVALADGRWVEIGDEWRALALGVAVRGLDGHVRTRTYSMRLGQRILNVIADPNIAYLLMMAGVLGL